MARTKGISWDPSGHYRAGELIVRGAENAARGDAALGQSIGSGLGAIGGAIRHDRERKQDKAEREQVRGEDQYRWEVGREDRLNAQALELEVKDLDDRERLLREMGAPHQSAFTQLQIAAAQDPNLMADPEFASRLSATMEPMRRTQEGIAALQAQRQALIGRVRGGIRGGQAGGPAQQAPGGMSGAPSGGMPAASSAIERRDRPAQQPADRGPVDWEYLFANGAQGAQGQAYLRAAPTQETLQGAKAAYPGSPPAAPAAAPAAPAAGAGVQLTDLEQQMARTAAEADAFKFEAQQAAKWSPLRAKTLMARAAEREVQAKVLESKAKDERDKMKQVEEGQRVAADLPLWQQSAKEMGYPDSLFARDWQMVLKGEIKPNDMIGNMEQYRALKGNEAQRGVSNEYRERSADRADAAAGLSVKRYELAARSMEERARAGDAKGAETSKRQAFTRISDMLEESATYNDTPEAIDRKMSVISPEMAREYLAQTRPDDPVFRAALERRAGSKQAVNEAPAGDVGGGGAVERWERGPDGKPRRAK